VALHVALVHQEIERHLEGRVDFARIELEREARFDARNYRHNAVAQRRHIEIEIAEGFDMLAVESDLFLGFAQRRRTRIGVTIIDLAARKRNLPRVIGQMLRALGEQHRRFGMVDDRDQHRGGTDRPHFGDLPHHRIGIVIAAHRYHVRIGETRRHVER
jgi:hypothetical protein